MQQLKPHVDLPALSELTLEETPLAERPSYRLEVIAALPQLSKLDNIIISDTERAEARSLMGPTNTPPSDPCGRPRAQASSPRAHDSARAAGRTRAPVSTGSSGPGSPTRRGPRQNASRSPPPPHKHAEDEQGTDEESQLYD